ncbi:VOC family protein [Candidatus Nitrotoga sp. M5]|uniref:VOC family protein n=1 Tax=Candidatus Nitrotoga sp. M5 TaxID=2890409 RepID=UPI001EF1F1F1|nr:VOC family protein [Candidatus Nitrotoga sp. M5]CAH1386588.1 Glyoxalase/Bleomycin resistance /Dioxygenase superfamily protein [Candidatus Nitrotoga sp. M5]
MKALFTSFPASDYAVSKQFYEEVVGLAIVREHESGPHRYTNYDLGGMVLKIYEWLEPYYGSGHSGLFIETTNLDIIVEKAREFGVKATEIQVHSWGGRCSSVTDPFGNIFDLIDSNQKGDA